MAPALFQPLCSSPSSGRPGHPENLYKSGFSSYTLHGHGLLYSILEADQCWGLGLRQIVSSLLTTPSVLGPSCGGEQRRACRAAWDHGRDGCFGLRLSPHCSLTPIGLGTPSTALFDSFASSQEPPQLQPSHGIQEICEI